jgi:hypothetical protein
MSVIIFEGYWKISDVEANPKYLFIFGDNDIGKGKGGQAIIRDLPNAMGIPTKKLPSFQCKAYYTDKEYNNNCNKINKAIDKIRIEYYRGKYIGIVLPKDGLGTGLSKLPTKAPLTYKYLVKKISDLIQEFV